MSGTPGFMAYESMAATPVVGAAGQDVVAVAMVLLMACLKKEHRFPNLFAKPVRQVRLQRTRESSQFIL